LLAHSTNRQEDEASTEESLESFQGEETTKQKGSREKGETCSKGQESTRR